ncbi:uncharacterized protein LOC122508907 [Leptopilina heterotoma]|uniref:uncharacterized protein LOC122508907 n=1 Tax=Leptopilina heterotoma TaxID=63436 RepID=UPI001CA8E1D0|nr:uncharacterized protein LOC122508907 [Leptopilina heterotoma]
MVKDFDNKFVLPVFVHCDDYETGNVLGSHAGDNKLGALYCRIACLPPKYASSIRHILLMLLFRSDHRKVFGNRAIFNPVIEEFNYLREHGLDINGEKVYIQLVLVLGDNLGLNSILGFTESFIAKFWCRICKADKSMMKLMLVEDRELLRTVENYEKDLESNDISQTGIKDICIWNEVKGVHITKNVGVDEMHDIPEGTAKYVMTDILDYLIFDPKTKYFTLEVLNYRIQVFNYGLLESSNKPPLISKKTASNVKIKMSSSEMSCFVRYFGLMIGDLVPKTDIVWKLYLKLRKILVITQSPKILKSTHYVLKQLVKEHHTMYCKIFKTHLKPKFHILLHYDSFLQNQVPTSSYSSLRFESKHKASKSAANVSCSKLNVPKTLAIKHQLQLAHFIEDGNHAQDFTIGPIVPNHRFSVLFYKLYFPTNKCVNEIDCVKWVNINGTNYTSETIVVTKIDSELPTFAKIVSVFIIKETVQFLLLELKSTRLEEHFDAFEVDAKPNSKREFVMSYNDLPCKFPCLLVQKNLQFYVATRYLLL